MDPLNTRTASINGGFDCEFENTPKELQSKCSICLLILREPYHTSCCGYSFCQVCIEQVITRAISPVCPLCQREFNISPNIWLKRELNQQRVYCTHKKEGCKWIGPLGKLDEHLNSDAETDDLTKGCGLVPIKCHACNESVPRKGYGIHISDLCEERPFSCEYCGEYNSTYLDVINNHWPRCPWHPVECLNKCGKHTKRKDLDQHLHDECPLSRIQCKFCPEMILRGEIHDHLVLNLTTHISVMVDEKLGALHQQVEEKMHELRCENRYLQDDVEKLRLDHGKNKEEIHRLRQDNLEAQYLSTEVHQQNDELMRMYKDLREEYEDLKQENEKLHKRADQLSDDIEYLRKEKESASSEASRHQLSQSSASDLHLPALEFPDHWGDFSIPTPVPPVKLRMPNYIGYSSGLTCQKDWMSTSFYSGAQPSYKLCLNVRASRNLSVYVRLMHGEFDDQLAWPFNADITIQLMNHDRGRHWERIILFRNGHRVIKGHVAAGGKGDPNFITLYENSSFIKDDSLWFTVVSVELVGHA